MIKREKQQWDSKRDGVKTWKFKKILFKKTCKLGLLQKRGQYYKITEESQTKNRSSTGRSTKWILKKMRDMYKIIYTVMIPSFYF